MHDFITDDAEDQKPPVGLALEFQSKMIKLKKENELRPHEEKEISLIMAQTIEIFKCKRDA